MSSGPAVGQDSVPPVSVLPRGLIILQGLSAAVITAAGIYLMAWLIAPVFLSLVIVVCVSPVQGWLRRHGVRHWLATAALVLSIYGLLVVLGVVLVIGIGQLTSLLPQYAEAAHDLVDSITGTLARFGVAPEELQTMAGAFDPAQLTDLLGSMLAELGNAVSNTVLVLCLLLFISLESRYAGARIARIAAERPQIAVALREFAWSTRRYMVVTTVFGVLTGIIDGTLLALLGVPLPVLWGLLAFITNYIPNVGFIFGLVPPALLALLDGGWGLMLAVTAVYIVINFVIESLVQPRFLGGAVGLSSTVTFVTLLFWAWVLGPVGAILAIPLTLLGKALLVDVDPRAGWLRALIGPRTIRPAPAETG
ncbi:AI-2E family transporter [Actinophytocola sp.]|uniref:AI-2E family transporter n=1 Tax=Actinophytocola sp. TaxID=1872138 RepID=UPI002D7FE920|nr:AI-2E family transporter [Actinophytocola sp.]HET9139334.1 AI-2E family transporter [Actinophytocola sp.]